MIPSLLATSDVLGTGWFAADAANLKPGMTVVVVGDGAVGLLAVLSAGQMGAERIIAMSRAIALERYRTIPVQLQLFYGVRRYVALIRKRLLARRFSSNGRYITRPLFAATNMTGESTNKCAVVNLRFVTGVFRINWGANLLRILLLPRL